MSLNIDDNNLLYPQARYWVDSGAVTKCTTTQVTLRGQKVPLAMFPSVVQADPCKELAEQQPQVLKLIVEANAKYLLLEIGGLLAAKSAESKNRVLNAREEVAGVDGINMETIDPFEYAPIVDVKTARKYMYHIPTNTMADICPEAWDLAGLTVEDGDVYAPRMAEVSYMPQSDWEFMQGETARAEQLMLVNSYKQSMYKALEQTDTQYQCPEIIDKFLKFLLPNPKARFYALRWLRDSLQGKQIQALVLNGVQGTGKSLFASLATAIHGPHNTHISDRSLWQGSGSFNKALVDCTLLVVDDIHVGFRGYESLKAWTNPRISLHQKGIDPIEVTIHCNFLFLANDMDSTYVHYNDRRMAVLDVADRGLLTDALSREEVATLVAAMDTIEPHPLIEAFYHWLMSLDLDGVKEQYIQDLYVGDRTYDLMEHHLAHWEKYLVKQFAYDPVGDVDILVLLTDDAGLDMEEVAKGFKKYISDTVGSKKGSLPYEPTRLQGFLNSYRFRGKHRIAEAVLTDEGLVFKADKEYLYHVAKTQGYPIPSGLKYLQEAEEMIDDL